MASLQDGLERDLLDLEYGKVQKIKKAPSGRLLFNLSYFNLHTEI